MPKPTGNFTFVLHSHLPYVITHGKWPHGMDWLDEAACGTYIPLLNVFNELVQEGLSPKVTLGVTPILTEMLANPIFKENLGHYLNNKIEIARENEKDFHRTGERDMEFLANMWASWYQERLNDFNDKYDCEDHCDIGNDFEQDLSSLGEALATRIELEDKILRVL